MRTNISKMWRAVLAMLMVLCMTVGLFPAAVFAAEDATDYVSLGDSMSSGFGLSDASKAYPAKVAASFGWKLDQRAVSGISAADLSDMLADDSTAVPLRAAVSGADVISLGMGSTDFGTILVENVLKAADGEVMDIDLESAVQGYPQELQMMITAMQEQLGSMLDMKIREQVADGEKAAAMCDTMVNCTMSFLVSYADVLNNIMALNSDATVILVGVPNIFDGKDVSAESKTLGFSLKEAMDEMLPYINANIAGIPAAMKLLGEETYAQGTFYYAEAEDIQLMTCGCPSESGHDELAEAIVDAVKTDHSVTDELMDCKGEILQALVNSPSNTGTHGEICLKDDTYYVAIGDSPVVSKSYVDLLAGELGVSFKNLANKSLMVYKADVVVNANKAEIEKADLITVGFSNVPFLTEAVGELLSINNTKPEWSNFLTGDEIATIQTYLGKMEEKLEDYGIQDEDMKAKSMAAAERYLYNCVAYAVKMPELIDLIHEINPDALVAIVGMYNPLDGVTLNLGAGMNFAMGELFDDMVDLMGLYDIMYAMSHENTFYVYAPDVQTKLNQTVLSGLEISRVFIFGKGEELNPSQKGQAYVCDQIMNALTLVEEPIEEPEVPTEPSEPTEPTEPAEPTEPEETFALGDVDHSGDVNFFDGMLVLQYYAGVVDETGLDVSLADVDAGGSIDFFDGMYMLQYYAGVIDKLPGEKEPPKKQDVTPWG